MLSKEQLTEGRIVETYHFPGCTIYVNDAAYAGKSKEELEIICQEAWQYACELDVKAQLLAQDSPMQSKPEPYIK